jgi:hypothetical protein
LIFIVFYHFIFACQYIIKHVNFLRSPHFILFEFSWKLIKGFNEISYHLVYSFFVHFYFSIHLFSYHFIFSLKFKNFLVTDFLILSKLFSHFSGWIDFILDLSDRFLHFNNLLLQISIISLCHYFILLFLIQLQWKTIKTKFLFQNFLPIFKDLHYFRFYLSFFCHLFKSWKFFLQWLFNLLWFFGVLVNKFVPCIFNHWIQLYNFLFKWNYFFF